MLFRPILRNFEEYFLALPLLSGDINVTSLRRRACQLLCITEQRMGRIVFCAVKLREGSDLYLGTEQELLKAILSHCRLSAREL